MANRSTIETKAPLLSEKEINVGGNGKHNIKLKVNRNTVIRIKRDESRKQGDKDTHQRNGTNDRNSKDRRLQNSDTIQGDINCPCEPQRGYEALDYLAEKFSIHMGYWTYGRRLKESLQMFRKSNLDFYANKE